MAKKPRAQNQNLFDREGIFWLNITIEGHRYRESLSTGDIFEARKIRDKRIEEIKKERNGQGVLSWKEAVARWHASECDQVGPATLKRYLVSLAKVEPYLSHLSISAIDFEAINAMVEARKKVAKTATIRRDLTAVSRVLEFAEDQGWRKGNPTLAKRKRMKERRDPIFLPDTSSITDVCTNSSQGFRLLILAALHTGCRQSELTSATWRNLTVRTRTLELIGKGNKRRTIKLSDEALPYFVLATKLATRRGPDDTIFQTEDGEPFRQAASDFTHVRRIAEFKAFKEGRPFRRFRFHDLRHLFAVEWLRRGGGLYALSKHLGHTSVKTTETHYLAFLTPDEQEIAKAA